MSEKRNINLTIADIPLNLNISAADEEIIRKAAKEINERVLKYKTGNINSCGNTSRYSSACRHTE